MKRPKINVKEAGVGPFFIAIILLTRWGCPALPGVIQRRILNYRWVP